MISTWGDKCYTFAAAMSKLCCHVVALLLAVFTFNQVAMSYALTIDSRTEVCDLLEVEAEKTAETLELKLKEVNGFAPVLMAFMVLRDSGSFSPIRIQRPQGSTPHGNHVPIYIDERVLRI